MKRTRFICCAYLFLLLTACRTTAYDSPAAANAGFLRLPLGAEVAGIRVSLLSRERAKDLLARALGTPRIELIVEDTVCPVSGHALGLHYDLNAALDTAFSERTVSSVPLAIDRTVLEARIDLFARQTDLPPTDAALTLDRTEEMPFAYKADLDGRTVDTETLAERIRLAAQQNSSHLRIHVPTKATEANITLEDLKHETQPLARFTTSYADAPLNDPERIFNIQKAAGAIHGTLLLPGEEFNCNAVIGDRSKENGWREAAAIRGGMYTSEYGGGVCQVSSTLFNAVMIADLPITERYPHSWPMRYVSIGCDATISTGGKNFRFVNDRKTPVIIGMVADKRTQTLTCTLYGTPLPQGQYVRIRSEETAALDLLPEEYILDPSLPLQTRITQRESRQGKTAVTYKDYYTADGTLLRTEIAHRDTYRSIAARILVSSDLYDLPEAGTVD